MAYTVDQLSTFFKNANAGTGPTAAQTLSLQALANQNAAGTLSNDQALAATVDLASDSTTGVSVGAYQFFLGYAPSEAGLASLNAAYVGAGSQASLNGESRFIAQSISLALQNPTAKANFAASYGSLSVEAATKAAYDIIIGNAAAAAAGIDVSKSIAFLTGQTAYYTAFVKQVLPGLSAEDQALAVKAAIIGEILFVATSYNNGAGIGSYATATTALIKDLADDGHLVANNANGVDLFASYGGTGTVGSSFNLTTAIDTLVGTVNNDTFNGQVNATDNTVSALDTIDGGAGNDTLNLADGVGATLDATLLTVKNVETVNLTSKTGLAAGALDVSGWTGLTAANVVLQDVGTTASDQTVTAGSGTAVVVNAAKVGARDVIVQGGGSVTVSTTGGIAAGNVVVGSVTAPTGAVTVSTSGTYAGADITLGTVSVTGGSSVSVTETAGITAAQALAASTAAAGVNKTVTLGNVTVNGTTATTSVSVKQDAKVVAADDSGAGDGVIGVTNGTVTINDVNAGSATKAGTITTVTLANGTQTVASNALTTLNVSGGNTTTLTLSTTNATTSKALTVNAAGGTTALTDTNAVLTSFVANATATSTISLTANGVVTATLGGAKGLTFTPTSTTALKTVNITGAGGVTSDLSTTGVTKIDASASSGANKVTMNAATAKIAYIGGTGADSVTINGTLDANASIQLGAGNDRLLGGTTPVIGASTTAVIDGGDGTDAISSALISATNASMFKNFEVLNLQSTLGDIVDVSLLSGSTITGLELNGGTGAASYSNITTAQSLSVTGTSGAGSAATLVFTGVAGTADSYSINFNAAVTGTASSPTAINARAVTIGGIENVNISSGGTGGVASNAITLTDADARTLTITGSQAINVAFATAFGTAGVNGVNIDASAATGAVTLNLGTALGLVDGGSTVKTGSGADAITVGAITGQINLTTGAGKDVIDVSAMVGTFGSGATAASHLTITDFSATDTLKFADAGTETFTSTKVDLTGVNDFAAALDKAAASATAGANGVITWFQYGNNTYIVEDHNNATTFTAGTDIVVKLTGLVDLSSAVLSGAAAGAPSLTLV